MSPPARCPRRVPGGWAQSILLGAVVFGALAGCSSPRQADDFSGYVEAELLYVSAPEAGWLTALEVSPGMEVTEGAVLFTLDSEQQRAIQREAQERLKQAEAQAGDLTTGARREEVAVLRAQLAEAEAGLALAEREEARSASIQEAGGASAEQVDRAKTNVRSASARVRTIQANLRVAQLGARAGTQAAARAGLEATAAALAQADWRLKQRTVLAQVAGRVEETFQQRGEYVVPGTPIIAMLPAGALKVRFFVPQDELVRLKVGNPVRVTADGSRDVFEAPITRIATAAEFTPPVIYSASSREKLVFLVEARLSDEASLRPGLPVDVALP